MPETAGKNCGKFAWERTAEITAWLGGTEKKLHHFFATFPRRQWHISGMFYFWNIPLKSLKLKINKKRKFYNDGK